MKKTLNLLSVLTITATTPTAIAVDSYQRVTNIIQSSDDGWSKINFEYDNWSEIDFDKIKNLENDLKKELIEKDYVISKVITAVNKAYFNFNKKKKPSGTLFFAGPTGVGKTFVVKMLSKILFGDEKDSQFISFDMSDYLTVKSEKEFISNLGKFNPDKVNILLFDEIEKAHIKIWDKFLQILGKAKINISDGKTIDFSKSLIIFISNIGATEIEYQENKEKIREEFINKVSDYFQKNLKRPELLTRIGINNIVPFYFVSEALCKKTIIAEIVVLKDTIKKKWNNIEFKINNETELVDHIFKIIDFLRYYNDKLKL